MLDPTAGFSAAERMRDGERAGADGRGAAEVIEGATILCGDALEMLRTLPAASAHCCVTSPPYWGLREYKAGPKEIGKEKTPEEFVANLVAVFRDVRRVLRPDATLWVNLGDSYAGAAGGGQGKTGDRATRTFTARIRQKSGEGLKNKDLVGIPWMTAFALRANGWYLRRDIVWHKLNPMPESITDRPTTAHEYVFLLSAAERYYYDAAAIREPDGGKLAGNRDGFKGKQGTAAYQAQSGGEGSDGWKGLGEGRNKRSVWPIASQPYPGAHCAVMPPALVEPCILAGCPPGGVVLDPFAGACTTGLVALRNSRRFVGIELNPATVEEGRTRLDNDPKIYAEQRQARLFPVAEQAALFE